MNKYKIGPKLLFAKDDYLAYQFVEGDFIVDYLRKSNKNQIKKILKNIFNQLFVLDKLKIDKEEMHRPVKHIIVNKNKAYLIDFERTHHAKKPKNITQFCQFLIGGYILEILKSKKIYINKNNVMQLTKIYKKKQTFKNFKRILNFC